MTNIRNVAIYAVVITLLGCSQMDATRDFNYGVKYYNEKKFSAAVSSFERASEALPEAVVRFNLALSHLALLRESLTGDEASKIQPKQLSAALDSVAAARDVPKPTLEILAKLGYVEGSIHALAGNEEAARRSFADSLEAKWDFKPTLKALLELDPDSDSAVARLVLASADVEAVKLEEKL